MGAHLLSRLECVLCPVVYVLPFVDRSLDMPFLFAFALRFTRVP